MTLTTINYTRGAEYNSIYADINPVDRTGNPSMDKIGITGMTVTNVLGYGIQGGYHEFYRGVGYETNLLPKVKVEIVVSKIPVRTVIKTAKRVLYTAISMMRKSSYTGLKML